MTAQGEDILAYLDHAITAAERLARGAKLRSAGHWTANEEGDSFAVSDDLGDVVVYDEGAPSGLQPDHIALNDPASVLRRCAADRRLVDLYTITKRLAEHADDADAVDLIDAARKNLRALESVVRILAEGYGWTGASDE